MVKVTIIIGSESDKHIADKAIEVLEKYNVPYDIHVGSAHRDPAKVHSIIKNSDAEIFICVAGLAAALPGFVSSLTKKPVIGVPVDVKLGGLDSLLSISQMPPGVPVATVGIDNGKNAAYLAIRILALKYGQPPRPSSYQESSTTTMNEAPAESFSAFSMFDQAESQQTTDSGVSSIDELLSSDDTPKKTTSERPRGDWLVL